MVSTGKKRKSSRRLLSQLDDFDQDVIIGNATSERPKNDVVNEGTSDRDVTTGISNNNLANSESAVNIKALERCFNERIDREMSNIIDTVEVRIQNAILTAIENIVTPKIELAIRSTNASSGRDVTSGIANSERGEQAGIDAFFEDASGNNKKCNRNDETRTNTPNEASGLPVPETHFDRQPHTHHMVTGHSNPIHHMVTGHSNPTHHMVTGQKDQTNQIPEFLTGRILTPRNPSSPQHQHLSTQVSQDNILPVVEQTPKNHNYDANSSINRLADTITGIATQQQPQATTMLKPVSTNTFEVFEDLFHKMLKMQPEMTEAMKINHFHAHLRTEALQTIRNISASYKKTLDDVLIVPRQKYVKLESQATA